MRIARRFNAGGLANGRIKSRRDGWRITPICLIQPSLRDLNSHDNIPGVETTGYFREVPPEQIFAVRSLSL